jgi:YfiH family protein
MKLMHYIKPNWPALPHVKACTTTRSAPGFSQTPFQHFNIADHTGDESENVEKNRVLLHKDLNLPEEIIWLNQVHGTHAVAIDHQTQTPEADACFTQKTNKVCAVMTGDCLPLLVCNQDGTEIAAIHAGWRGLLAGVIENTLQHLQSKPESLMVWLGPAIGPNHFEINDQIRSDFLAKNPKFTSGFIARDPNRWFADLFVLARITLMNQGVTAVYGGDYCTYSDAENFYSYRRDGGVTGRMASLIWLEPLSKISI